MATNVYNTYCEKLANKIYNLIKGNPLKWKKGWASNICQPLNVGTGHRYSGGNAFCMSLDCALYGNRPFFISQKELNEILGLKPKTKDFIKTKFIKNKSWLLIPTFKTVKDENGVVELDDKGKEKKTLAYFKTFPVANVDEIIRKYPQHEEKLDAYLKAEGYLTDKGNDNDPNLYTTHKAKLTTILDSLNCTLTEQGDRAYFAPAQKRVNMPLYGDFFEGSQWVGTLAHEVGHATKLDTSYSKNAERGGLKFGDQKYAQEELVAEISPITLLICNLG